MKYALVTVDVSSRDVDRLFTYAVPENMNVEIGARVRVPFGAQGIIDGYVLGLTDECNIPKNRIKSIFSSEGDVPVLTEEQIFLAQWIKKKYHAVTSDAVRLFVPGEVRGGTKPKTVQIVRFNGDREQAELILSSLKPGTKAYRIISLLAEAGEMEKSNLNKIIGGCYEPLKKFIADGTVESYSETVQRSPYLDITPEHAEWLNLNSGQKSVLNAILTSRDTFTPFLLHGVTGSGKTEVYMRAINNVVQNGKTALVLVPEISLTPQTVLNFRKKLGDGIAVLHSALSQGERYDEWRRIRTGKSKIVIGVRSAVFAPLENLGLIIVDEEHETSYISDTHPRYDAVEVAIRRAKYNNCPIVLGSATPSVIRYYRALHGEYKLLEMNGRANGHPLPPVDIVDMTAEFSSGNRTIFSRKLYSAMSETLAKNQQLMLFLNRRGYSSFVMCRACGETVTCQNCDVSLTYHSTVDKLRCHYCGYEIPMPKVCPNCGSKFIKQFGAGTQKVEEEFQRLFPGKTTVRMDVDTTRGRDAHYKLLKKLASGEAQALIGTQMIAKGHDFPLVTLVGVVVADGMLKLPDYRSRERTFSLLTQVSGRAGRAENEGRVIIQTYAPKHFVIECAQKQDYKAFYQKEIEERKAMWYPPFSRLIRILYTCSDSKKAFNASVEAYDRIREILKNKKEQILYAQRSQAPIGRLNEMYRQQILIKLKETDETDGIESAVYEATENIASGDLYCDIQINPVTMF